MMKRRSLLTALALPAMAWAARPLRVVASFSILADWVKIIGGDAVDVTCLVGADADAHVFEPSPADARRLREADLVVVNGLGFEGWIDRLVRASGYAGPVVIASAGITPLLVGTSIDPHAWQDLTLARRYVQNLRSALIAARPAEAAAFSQRAQRYGDTLARLDSEIRKRFEAIPVAQRRVITSHDAFGYFGAAYDIEFMAPQGRSTDGQASAAAVARLIGQIRRHAVRAVFVENIVDPRLIERIAREGGAVLGGRLYSDALSKPGSEADSYLKLFSHNAQAIAAALAATAI